MNLADSTRTCSLFLEIKNVNGTHTPHHTACTLVILSSWKLTSAHILIYFFLSHSCSLSDTHTHTGTHKAAHHVATCQAVSRLHRCDSFSDLQSLKSLSLCRWWSSGNCTHISLLTLWIKWNLCVCVCVCVNMCILSDTYVSGLTVIFCCHLVSRWSCLRGLSQQKYI